MRQLQNGKWSVIYFGITNDLSTRFDSHHAMPCIKRNGATHIGVHVNTRKTDRENQELDLLSQYKTACNIINN